MIKKLYQEFYCNDCNGFIRIRLNMSYDRKVGIVCPNCGRKHPRFIKNGKIVEDGYHSKDDFKEEVCAPKSAYSKDPISKINKYAREGLEIKEEESDAEKVRQGFFREAWLKLTGDK